MENRPKPTGVIYRVGDLKNAYDNIISKTRGFLRETQHHPMAVTCYDETLKSATIARTLLDRFPDHHSMVLPAIPREFTRPTDSPSEMGLSFIDYYRTNQFHTYPPSPSSQNRKETGAPILGFN